MVIDEIAALQPTRAGMDYGSKQDASEIIFSRKEEGKDKIIANVTMQYISYSTQETIAKRLAALCPDGFYVDATGPGAGIASHLEDATGNATGVTFTSKTKETLAIDLKRAMQDGKITLPEDMPLSAQLHSIKRSRGAMAFRYDADRSRGHHADKFWALAMAISEGIRGGGIEFSAWNP
jgi:phage FluMu gp28-like protein